MEPAQTQEPEWMDWEHGRRRERTQSENGKQVATSRREQRGAACDDEAGRATVINGGRRLRS